MLESGGLELGIITSKAGFLSQTIMFSAVKDTLFVEHILTSADDWVMKGFDIVCKTFLFGDSHFEWTKMTPSPIIKDLVTFCLTH